MLLDYDKTYSFKDDKKLCTICNSDILQIRAPSTYWECKLCKYVIIFCKADLYNYDTTINLSYVVVGGNMIVLLKKMPNPTNLYSINPNLIKNKVILNLPFPIELKDLLDKCEKLSVLI